MKKTITILAMMAFGMAFANAGEPAPAPSGKGVGAVGPTPVDPCAGPISYSNVELLYANTDSGFGGDSADGVSLRVEYSMWSNFYLTGGVNYTDYDLGELWTATGGLGVYFPLTQNIHIALDGGVYYWDLEHDVIAAVPTKTKGNTVPVVATVSDDDTGWYARPHIRAKWSCFEVHAGAMYVDVSDQEEWNLFIQLYYQVAPHWDITAGYSEWDDSDGEAWTIGGRYKF